MTRKKFKITGMHCVSCACDIDWSLEDVAGIVESKTNYATQEAEVTFEQNIISEQKIITIIGSIDKRYQAKIL